MYLNIYVRQDRPITDNQFKNLPPDLKNKYIGFGVGLSNEQVKMIDSKLNTRYEDVTKTKIKKTIGTEDEISLKPSEADIFLKYVNEFDLNLLTDENIAGIYASGSFNVIRYLIDEGVKVINSKSVQNAADSGNLDLVKYLLGDEVRDEQGNIYKLPKGTRPGNMSDNSVRNAKSEEIKDYLIKSRQEQEMAAFKNF